ncbi:MAG: sarcosine oxidase subunit gamma family protein [Kiloniellales bacterium]|nr:sarcosine oxidase subunit gamma family protein [Kiloniellales bacterium]
MAEQFLRQSPLAHLGLEGQAQADMGEAGVALAERPFPAIVDLRGESGALAGPLKAAFEIDLPREAGGTAHKNGLSVLWLGPDQWWLVDESGRLAAVQVSDALSGPAHAATNVGESRTRIRVSGPRARDLLAKGCPLDLHPRVFPEGSCAQSLVAKAGVLIHCLEDGAGYDLYVIRSFAEYLWRWLADAAREYGFAVLPR